MIGIGIGLNRQLFAGGFANAYNTRVLADNGTIEATPCVNAASTLLQSASLLLIPSGYKSGVAYSQLPNNGNGDLTWTRASTANRTNSLGLLESMAMGVPRLSYMYGSCPALLLEPQRTNSIRNSTMQGAVTGSPGTSPSNWTITNAGMTRSIALGTENGLSYIDITYNGTANASIIVLNFESNISIIASNGQIWTSSFYVKLIDSTQLPVSFGNYIYERTSAGAYVTEGNQSISPTSTLQRFTYTRTLNGGATVGAVYNALGMVLTNGNSYNFTIRVYQPQMELGAFATTPIFTSGATATRVADSFTRNNIYTNGLITSSGGTWLVELRNNVAYTRDTGINGLFLSESSTGSQNSLSFRNTGGANSRLVIQKFIGTNNSDLYTLTTSTAKIAMKWDGSTVDVFVNGTKVVSASAFTYTQLQFLAHSVNVDVPKFIQQMALYPTPLSDSDCVSLTT